MNHSGKVDRKGRSSYSPKENSELNSGANSNKNGRVASITSPLATALQEAMLKMKGEYSLLCRWGRK